MLASSFSHGMILFEQKRYTQAADAFRESLRANPEDPGVLSMLAVCLSRTGDFRGAEAAAAEAVRIAPLDPHIHSTRAELLSRAGRTQDAIQAVGESIRLDRDNPEFARQRAGLYLSAGLPDSAVRESERGLSLDPASRECLVIRAGGFLELNRMGKAKSAIDAALKADPENAEPHVLLGRFHLRMHRAMSALRAFRDALRIDPENEAARTGLIEAMRLRYPGYRLISDPDHFARYASGFFYFVFAMTGYVLSDAMKPYTGSSYRMIYVRIVALALAAILPFPLILWAGIPFFNLFLRMHPFGRHVLRDDERNASTWAGGLVAVSIVFLAAGLILLNPALGYAAAVSLASAVVVGAAFHVRAGWARILQIVLAVAGICAGGVTTYLVFSRRALTFDVWTEFGAGFALLLVLSILLVRLSHKSGRLPGN